ncbi:MAG: F0F1 ATP synthase subunit B [Candidatus Margulisbacteria bacterium]|nr:F0F1 ATP synthase subunit B [Candidatus Margulisiibacteriota bacterium]
MEESLNIKLIIFNVTAFVVMLFVIKYVVWPKLSLFIDNRRKKIEELLKTYNERNEEVANLVEKMKQESEKASERRNKLLEDARLDSKRIREEIIEKAYNEANEMMEQARQEIQREKKQAYTDVRQKISKVVIEAVENILCNVIDKDLDKKIILETEKRVNIIHETQSIS